MKNLTKNIIIAIVVIVVLYMAYVYLVAPDNSSSSLIVQSNTGVQVDASGQPLVGQDIVTALMQLDQVQIDSSFFSDTSYLSLQDFGIPIDSSQVPGKSDPFTPLPGGNLTAAASALNTATSLKLSNPATKKK